MASSKPRPAADPSPQDSLIYLMVVVSAADRLMTDRELARMGTVVRSLPVFEDFEPDHLVVAARRCQEILQAEDGLETVMDMVRSTVPEPLYDTAYAIAVEVATADPRVEQEVLRILQILRNRLRLDPLVVAAIERAARARNRSLG
jgi:tellurite resistance protein